MWRLPREWPPPRARRVDSRLPCPGSGCCCRFERARDFLGAIALDDVADLDVVEVLDANAALETFAHLVLKALERGNRAVEHLHAVADDTDTALPVDHAAPHRAAGNRADA